jgi:hypothetical protein
MLDKYHVVQNKAHLCYTIIGKKGSGKSALLERMCESFHALGRVIIDVNGSPDLEQLAACVPNPDRPKDRQTAYPLLVVIPRSTEIKSDGRTITTKEGKTIEAVKTVYDDTPLHQIINQANAERRWVIFNIYLYDSPSKGQKKLSDLIFGLPNVMRDHVSTDVSLVVAIRELADLSGSKMNAYSGTGSRESKRSLNFLSRQIRHFRTSLIVDTQNLQDVYSAFVANQDLLLIKNIHAMNIPPQYIWFLKDIQRKLAFARAHYMMDKINIVSPDRLSPNSFYCIYPDNDYKIFHNSEPSFLHHRPEHDAKALAGISIRYLSRTEYLNITSQDKILQIQQQNTVKEERDKLLNEALQWYKAEKAKDPRVSWKDAAKQFNFTGIDGKPNGHSLMMAVQRAAAAGRIQGYTKD